MAKYAKSRDAAIDQYLSGLQDRLVLDLIFISHAHADHLNGIQRLLSSKKKITVDTIMMPLFTIEERLLAYGRTATEDAKSASNAFYRDFIVDPAVALSRYKPRRVIYVRQGNAPDGAPYSRGPDLPPNWNDEENKRAIDFDQVGWGLVGKGTVAVLPDNAGQVAGCDVLLMDDTLALVKSRGSSSNWLLAPYVDSTVKSKLIAFLKELAKLMKVNVTELKKQLKDTTYVKSLIVSHTSNLKKAYAVVASDLNITSMCLYSGPANKVAVSGLQYLCGFGQWGFSKDNDPRVAWLGTGDAALANSGRRSAFLLHFDQLLNFVGTLGLPHHGSDHNFHSELLERIDPHLCVASADKFSQWRHPGTAVAQATASKGRFVSVVTSNPASEIIELIRTT